nr:helix-turn-helix domain-containing protein [Pseudoalteromonas luteoviolacea]
MAERKITIANAAKLLNKSRRTVERYLQRYRSQGYSSLFTGIRAVSQLIKLQIGLSSKFSR